MSSVTSNNVCTEHYEVQHNDVLDDYGVVACNEQGNVIYTLLGPHQSGDDPKYRRNDAEMVVGTYSKHIVGESVPVKAVFVGATPKSVIQIIVYAE